MLSLCHRIEPGQTSARILLMQAEIANLNKSTRYL